MTALVPTNAKAHGVPPAIRSVCILSETGSAHFSTVSALATLNHQGLLDQIPAAAVAARKALVPVDHNRLTDRLTALGMMMAPNRPPAEARVWLNEMARLLADLPEDILADAIDGLVKTSKFLPTCSEIRERAEPLAAERRRMAGQIEAMQRYIDSGQPMPVRRAAEPPRPREPAKPMTPAEVEEVNAILARVGASTRYRDNGSRYEVDTGPSAKRENRPPPRKPTRADYIAMGVDPAVLDRDRDGAEGGDANAAPVPQDRQARAEGIAQNTTISIT